jgi:L-ribulose-5-phosphate 4-epimerase
MLEELKQEVHRGNMDLYRAGLVAWTSGNVSGRDRQTGHVVIKPSGVRYEELTPEAVVVVDSGGNVIEGDLRPSVDTQTHLYIYKHMPRVMAITHTHSSYATSFAALGKPIPVVLTAIADEFGGEIPCARYAKIGSDDIGKAVVETIGGSPAVLLKNHGVFTVGRTVEAAVKAAVMAEDVARTVHLAMMKGKPAPIPTEEVERAHRCYLERYGQDGSGE